MLEPSDGTVDFRRHVRGLLRYKWLLAVGLVVGISGGAVAWNSVPTQYTAEGNLWIEVQDDRRGGGGDVTPIRASGLLDASAWIELLRSYAVMDSVVVAERLYVNTSREYSPAFTTFTLKETFSSGSFELQITSDGRRYTLSTADGVVVEEGDIGGRVGESFGFSWSPPAGSFEPGASVAFTVLAPRDAARQLSDELRTFMARDGSFIQLSLSGTDGERIASTLNAVMDRHVKLAAELKRARLDEQLLILEEQLGYTEAELADAEQELEEFRVRTISLPSDRAPIAAGLQITRDPVFDRFFEMRVQLEEKSTDRDRLAAVLQSFRDGGTVRIEALEVIPAAAAASELRRGLDDLVEARSQLRVLRDRYADDYPTVQQVLLQISTIETRSIPRVIEGIVAELDSQVRDLQARIDGASTDLAAIPPRTIEEGRLERRVQITGNLYNELRSRVETARLAAASSIPDVRILDRAQVPRQPMGDRRLFFAAGILFGCLGVATIGAILLDRMDVRFRDGSDVSRYIGLDILGSIPRIESRRGREGVLNAAQALEAFRELRIHLGFAYGSAGPITLAVSSPSSGEGKSLISSNLAVAFAEVGRRTLLIDGDTRRGDTHKLLSRAQSPGLVDYLKERTGHEIIQKTDHANLDFIASGSRGLSTPELLASSRMAQLVGALKRTYEVIIFDTPPLAAGGDSLILSTLMGNLAIVIRSGTTEKQLAQAKLDQLSRLPIRLLGAILNDVDPSDGYHYYYSSYLPGYEPVAEDSEERGAKLVGDTVGKRWSSRQT